MGEGVRHRGSSWLELESSRPLLEETLANQDLLEDIVSMRCSYEWSRGVVSLKDMSKGLPTKCHEDGALLSSADLAQNLVSNTLRSLRTR